MLALDVSSSVDQIEDALQRRGLAAALLSPEVREALFASPEPVAILPYEWSGRWDQVPLTQGWVLVETEADLLSLARAIGDSTRSRTDMPTALGYALGYGAAQFRHAPDCLQYTIDVAGDGINNEGFGPEEAYANFPNTGITVNALVVTGTDPAASSEVLGYYSTRVLRGPAAFLEVANGYADYERAMRRKLVRELAAIAVGSAAPPWDDAG